MGQTFRDSSLAVGRWSASVWIGLGGKSLRPLAREQTHYKYAGSWKTKASELMSPIKVITSALYK